MIHLPFLFRFLLLHGFILPKKLQKTTRAYQSIWTEKGSPLRYYSQQLCEQLQIKLSEKEYKVVLGMRYGNPSIQQALQQLNTCENITLLPLYPQYSSAATGSSIEEILNLLQKNTVFPSMHIIRDFYQHPSFIQAEASLIKPYLNNHDYLLFSYHGLPERHLTQLGCHPCAHACPPPSHASSNQGCYRAQCFQTTALLATSLALKPEQYGTSFQSRLGKASWIKPYTDVLLQELAARGIKRLAIACPSFVADCLETIEEIGIRAKKQWHTLGGETLTLIPSLNDEPIWVNAIMEIIKCESKTSK